MSEATGKNVSFIEHCGDGYHFQIRQYKTIASTDINGKHTPSRITDKWEAPSSYAYSQISCFDAQVDNGDLVYMIRNDMTQDLKHRQ